MVGAVVVGAFVLWAGLDSGSDAPFGPVVGGVAASWVLGAAEVPSEAALVPVFAHDPSGGCGSYVTPRLRDPVVRYDADEIEIQLWLDPLAPGDYTCEGFDDELVVVQLTEPVGNRTIVGGDRDGGRQLPPGVRAGLSGIVIDADGETRFWHVDGDLCLELHQGESLCLDRQQADGSAFVAIRDGDLILAFGLLPAGSDAARLRVLGEDSPVTVGELVQGQTHVAFVLIDSLEVITTLEVVAIDDGETAAILVTNLDS